MSASLVQAYYDEANPSTSITVGFQSITVAGNFLVVGCRPSDGSLNMTVTAGGQTFTKVATAPIITEFSYSLYVLPNAPAVTSVTASGGDSSDQQRMWIAEFSGVATGGTIIEDFNTGSGSGSVMNAGNVTTATAGALLIMCAATDSDEFHTVPTPSTGWNLIDWDGPGPPNIPGDADPDKTGIMWKVAGAAGSYGGTMTDDQPPDWSAIIGAFAAVAEGGGSLTFAVLTQPTKGTLSGTAPNLTYTPTLNENGADSFTFNVNDGVADSATSTVTLSLTPESNNPVAHPKTVILPEDVVTPIRLTGSGGTLTFEVLTQPTKGTLSGIAPELTYTPTTDQTGADSFTFKVNNGTADSATSTISISIIPTTNTPVAHAKSVQLLEDVAVSITLTGSGGTLTFATLSSPTKGTLSGTAPNLTYTPTSGQTGADSFTFKVNNGAADSATVTVSINIIPVTNTPIAHAKTVILREDVVTPIVLTGVA